MVVDFPHPDSPTSAMLWPDEMDSCMSLRTWMSGRVGYEKLAPWKSTFPVRGGCNKDYTDSLSLLFIIHVSHQDLS